MSTLQERMEALTAPHVSIGWLVSIDHPDSGIARYHLGWGKVTAGGNDWLGINDPSGSQLVSLSSLRKPVYGEAGYADITIAAATPGFVKQYYDRRGDYQGRACNIYYRVIDQETGAEIISLKSWFPGLITGGRLSRIGRRFMNLAFKAVTKHERLNFNRAKDEWSPAGQRARYSGDKGLDLINADLQEVYR